MASVLELNIDVDRKNTQDIYKILERIRPRWEVKDIKIKDHTAGFLNFVYSIHNSSHPDDELAVRVFNTASVAVVDRNIEYKILKLVSQQTSMLHLFAKFNNGYVLRFIPGRPAGKQDVIKPDFAQKLFLELHKLHAVPLPADIEPDVMDYDFVLYALKKLEEVIFSEKGSKLDNEPRLLAEGLSREKLAEISQNIESGMKQLRDTLPKVYIHCDPKVSNIIVNDQTESVHLIDWDTAGVGVELLDLAIFMMRDELHILEECGFDVSEDESVLDKWLMLYLKTHPQFQSKPVSDEVFNNWKRDLLQILVLMPQLNIMLSLAFSVASDVSFDYIGFCLGMKEKSKIFQDMLSKMESQE